jgi:hypothetical protein
MSRRSLVSAHSGWRLGHSTGRGNPNRRSENSASLEERFFEYDRRVVSGLLNSLRDSLHEGAVQLEMVANEHMFDEPLSGNLSRASRRLAKIHRTLMSVLDDVAKAEGYPEIPVVTTVRRAEVRSLADRRSKATRS